MFSTGFVGTKHRFSSGIICSIWQDVIRHYKRGIRVPGFRQQVSHSFSLPARDVVVLSWRIHRILWLSIVFEFLKLSVFAVFP